MFPTLPAPYDSVLADATAELTANRVKAIHLAGSAANGTLRPPVSDLDVLVVDDGPWTIRHEFRSGIELHVTSGSEAAWRNVWQRELTSDLGANLSLMAGSVSLFDPVGIGAGLRSEAAALYAGGPKLGPEWIEGRRRWLTTLADDLRAAGPDDQPYICSLLVVMAVPCAFSLRGSWQPRHKEAMRLLARVNPAFHAAVNAALRCHTDESYAALIREVEVLLQPHGGWLRNET